MPTANESHRGAGGAQTGRRAVLRRVRQRIDSGLAVIGEGRKRINATQKLIMATHQVLKRNLATYKDAQATTQRLHEQLTQSRFTIPLVICQRSARQPHLLISARIDDGRLPDTASRMALVSGFDGKCEACDDRIPSTELARAIPKDETFVYLHADCYVIWQAQCRLRALLRRIA